jgi:FAD/FMN-containing dehydrogenase
MNGSSFQIKTFFMSIESISELKLSELKKTSLPNFKSKFSGELLFPDTDPYHAARKIWNGMIDRKPVIIAQCKTTADVAAAVNFARENNLLVSVRGGGHNVAGNSICDGGLMIDLSKLKGIEIDVPNKIARAQGGVIWRELDAATIPHQLAAVGGTVSDTGIGGLTLGGGFGWLGGMHATTSDNLISAELVTATGEILHVDESHHPDLFWAIRGGGGNFGVVTLFEYKLHKIHPTVTAGMILHPMERTKEMFQFFREYIRKAPEQLMSYSGFIVTPDGLPVAMMLPAWVGDPADADKWLGPLRKFGPPIADMVAEMPYTDLQKILDPAAPPGLRRYWKSGFFKDITDELLDIILKNLESRPSPLSPFLFFHVRGAMTTKNTDATAFANRKDQWDGDIISQWTDPTEDEKNIEWTRKFWKDIEPLSSSVYVNHLGNDDGNDRVRSSYGPNYSRLAAIKKKYDPENFFRMNNNILPA